MFRKPKKGFRARKAQGDSDEDRATETSLDPMEYGPKPPSTIVPGLDLISQDGEKKKKKKSKKDRDSKSESLPRNSSVLSFHDEEEG